MPSSTVLALSRANLLLDYDVKAPEIGEPFVPAVWDCTGFGAQGHHTALPWYFGPLLVTYNKDVFERAGLLSSPGFLRPPRCTRVRVHASPPRPLWGRL